MTTTVPRPSGVTAAAAPSVPTGGGVVEEIAAAVDALGLRLRKCVPAVVADPGAGLLIEAEPQPRLGPPTDPRLTETGVIAGRWHADAGVAAGLARRLGDDALLGAAGRLVVQLSGADPKLPALRAALLAPGATLVAHRSGKRAVVRDHDGFCKVVRRGRAAGIARATTAAGERTDAFRTPTVLAVDERHDTVRMATLSGVTLHDRLADPSLTDREIAGDLHIIGQALRRWHDTGPAPADHDPGAVHDPATELTVTRNWLLAAEAYGLLPGGAATPIARAELALEGLAATGLRRSHRDLHDKQLLLAHGLPVGLLDLDLITYADPALDLANLLAHLELRALQGRCPADRAVRAGAALLDGYRADAGLSARITGYRVATRLRLAGVYGFRRTDPTVIAALLAD